MRLAIIPVLVLVLLAFSVNALAETPAAPQSAAPTTTSPATEKSAKRKKKVQMCKECGKPESKCECKGHGNDPKPETK